MRNWACCNSTMRCGLGQGDCDSDNDCGDGLECGTDNCNNFFPEADPEADCCIKPGEAMNNFKLKGAGNSYSCGLL